jgi:hypothetical protein
VDQQENGRPHERFDGLHELQVGSQE